MLPRFTLPKLRLVELAFSSIVAATPVPESGIASGEEALLLVNEMDPFTVPAVLGAKVTLNVVLEPTFMFAGTVRPLMLNPVPDTVAWEIVNVAVPVF